MTLESALDLRQEYKKFVGNRLPDRESFIVTDIVVYPIDKEREFITEYYSIRNKSEFENESLLATYPLTDYSVYIIYYIPEDQKTMHESIESYITRNSS